MTPTLEEISDYWQDVLHVRCLGNVDMAVGAMIHDLTRYPNSANGRFARATLKFLASKGMFPRKIRNGNMMWR
jgi:hypothetical protein